MAHVHDPIIYRPDRHQILNGLKTAPFVIAAALGWLVGFSWHLLVLIFTGFGVVLGTGFLALRHLVYATFYGFLKGAQIKLEAKPRNPSMPM